MDQLPYSFTLHGLQVSFKGEAGSCLGPKRELFTILTEEIIKPERKLFQKTDGEQYFPVPNNYFFERMLSDPKTGKAKLEDDVIGDLFAADGDDLLNISDHDLSSAALDAVLNSPVKNGTCHYKTADEKKPYKRVLTSSTKAHKTLLDGRLEVVRFVGQLAAQVIVNEEIYIGMQLSKAFVKQVLGIPLSHPEDLESYDHQVYSSIKENEMEGLELPYSTAVVNPLNGCLEEIILGEENEELITEENKLDYLKNLSEFKLTACVDKELTMFERGFFNVIRRDVITIFNADEFSLLLNGVNKIDLEDWKTNTRYCGWSKSCLVVTWFWSVVSGLREEEKSLLLKFATGSTCVPAGGFSKLLGLSGPTLFRISQCGGVDMLPGASTCFNQLSLPAYTNEKVLREKLLIAIRHGCEGFAFG